MNKIGIIMGSDSDLPIAEKAIEKLAEYGINYEVHVYSAHRTPEETIRFAKEARQNGFDALIGIAGKAAHLAGVIAANTTLPVIGVPVNSSLEGMDALLSTVQMPPGIPVATVGIDGAANAAILAAEILAVSDEKLARALVEQRKAKAKEEEFKLFQKVTLDTLFDTISEGEMKELNIIVKADVQGSVEAVKQSLLKIENDEVNVKIVHGAVGAVSESDVMLAEASKAIIVAFNTGVDQIAADNAKRDGVEIKQYDIIYDAIEDIERAMRGMRAPKYRDVDTGEVEVREVYKISSAGTIAGSLVTSGTIKRDGKVRVIRNGKQIADVKLANLKRFKDEVKEVSSGYECGISLDGWDDIQSGDIL